MQNRPKICDSKWQEVSESPTSAAGSILLDVHHQPPQLYTRLNVSCWQDIQFTGSSKIRKNLKPERLEKFCLKMLKSL